MLRSGNSPGGIVAMLGVERFGLRQWQEVFLLLS